MSKIDGKIILTEEDDSNAVAYKRGLCPEEREGSENESIFLPGRGNNVGKPFPSSQSSVSGVSQAPQRGVRDCGNHS